MKFPIVLYGIDKSLLSRNIVTNTNSFYFYSYQKMNVKILKGVGTLYAVTSQNGQLNIVQGQQLSDNFGYTLIMENDRSTVIIEITTSGDKKQIQVSLNLDNVINEVHGNEHYSDMLVNYYLPTYEELSNAIPNEFNQRDIIKRLLLDFRSVLKYKGTKKGIENFFNIIGYADSNLKIYDIFKKPTSEETLKPNTATDTKTGDYHVLYENFENNGLDQDNLPIDSFIIENLDDFKIKLINSIVLANTYFTVEEQNIKFFGLEYSSNIANYSSFTSFMSKIHEIDVNQFRKNIDVNASYFTDSQHEFDVVKHKKMIQKNLYLTESKYTITTPKNNNEIYFVDSEIYDDEVLGEFGTYERKFAIILHFNINAVNLFLEYKIINKSNPLSTLKVNKFWSESNVTKQVAFTKSGNYSLIVTTWDTFNNKEEYHFDFVISANISKIDFETFNSAIVSDDFKELNKINLDPDSNIESINKSDNFVLKLQDIPVDLHTYYQQAVAPSNYLTNIERKILLEINKNTALNTITESLPLKYIDNWLNIISCKVTNNSQLKIQIYDGNDCQYKLIDVKDIGLYDINQDCIYVTIMDILENGMFIPYYFITTTRTGVLINDSTIKFMVIENGNVKNIGNVDGYTNHILTVNSDFPLFPVKSELLPNFEPYISDSDDKDENGFVLIKSVFPRLIDISSDIADGSNILKLGDIFLCRLNDKYVVNQKDVVWKVINSFTKKIIYKCIGFALSYRIAENTVYDVSCEFTVDGKPYSIYKNSLITSFE